jgi:hypothetical protein
MHRIGSRRYVGGPLETVKVSTRVSDGGQASVFVDEVDMGPNTEFPLPADPGGGIQWQVHLTGKAGTTCVVEIRTVDGGFDSDFLICQVHNPSPVNTYECAVASESAVRAFSQTRSAGLRKAPRRRTVTKKKRVTTKSVMKKSRAKKNRAKKSGAARTAKKGRRS